MKTSAILASVAGLAMASAAMAQGGDLVKTYATAHVPPLALADFTSAPGVTSSTIIVNDVGIIDTFDAVVIDISHTWVGDLTIELQHNQNVVRLIARPGFGGTQNPAFGNSDNLNGIYSFVRNGGAAFPADATGADVPTAPLYAPVDPFAIFDGKPKEGDWTLRIIDSAAGDTGELRGWGFGLTNTPAPGAAALLGLGGLMAARRRRA